MNSTLIVIDMQDHFLGYFNLKCYKGATSSIKKLILQAVKNKQHIIFVEFSNYSNKLLGAFGKESCKRYPTCSELTYLVRDYLHVTYVYKTKLGGGSQIIEAIKAHNIPNDILNICGIYTSQCVEETVRELSYLSKSRIHVHKHAVVDYLGHPENHLFSLKKMATFNNVQVI